MRYRGPLMRMLFEHHDTERLVVCLDPASIELLDVFCAESCLNWSENFADDYLRGDVQHVGLTGAVASNDTMKTL